MGRAEIIILVAATIMASTWTGAQSRTWYVTVDGTGDAPTIQAGIDSAVAGDTVLVGPGEYFVAEEMEIKAGVIVISEAGPIHTIIRQRGYDVIRGITIRSGAELNGFFLDRFGSFISLSMTNSRGMLCNNIVRGLSELVYVGDAVYIKNNLFLPIDGSGGVTFEADGYLSNIWNNIFIAGVVCSGSPSFPYTHCNDLVGLYAWDCMSRSDSWTNFDLDPQFCGIEGSGNYYLQSDSPCAPGNHPNGIDCGVIGPLPVGCSTVRAEYKSWGAIKAIYEE